MTVTAKNPTQITNTNYLEFFILIQKFISGIFMKTKTPISKF